MIIKGYIAIFILKLSIFRSEKGVEMLRTVRARHFAHISSSHRVIPLEKYRKKCTNINQIYKAATYCKCIYNYVITHVLDLYISFMRTCLIFFMLIKVGSFYLCLVNSSWDVIRYYHLFLFVEICKKYKY